MSTIKYHCYDKACYKEIGELRIYLYKGCDIVNGRGWFCHIYNDWGKSVASFGRLKITAFRNAIKQMS